MKTLLRLFAVFAAMLVALVAIIKFVQKCSWKEAVGIAEELWNEIRENCCAYHAGANGENPADEL